MQTLGRLCGLRGRVALGWLGALSALLGIACGGAGGGSAAIGVGGSGVKGPLAGAVVRVYAVDLAAADLRGALIAQAATDATSAIAGLSLPTGTTGYLLFEFEADADTVDITSGLAPVVTLLTTIIEAARVLAGDPVYATPLTTLAVEIAAQNAGTAGIFGGDGDASLSGAELAAGLAVAGAQVASTLGFGLLDGENVFDAAPMLRADDDTSQEQARVAAYRTANEALAAVLQSLSDDAGGAVDHDALLRGLATDLGDGVIDGMSASGAIADLAAAPNFDSLIVQDPSGLMIPGTGRLVSEADEILAEELAVTGAEVDASDLVDGTVSATPTEAEIYPDSDGDATRDNDDNCPADANADQLDTDLDTEGDVCDADDDDDGAQDADDAFPLDPNEQLDTDGDGTGDNADTDDDEDGSLDVDDDFPLDSTETTDTDGDGTGDNADTDDDEDGTLDADDAFPLDPAEQTDTDGDGQGDNADPDDDGDGVADMADNCPATENPGQEDIDGDGVGDACETGVTSWDEFNWDEAPWG